MSAAYDDEGYYEDGYYEDDGEFPDDFHLQTREQLRNRMIAVFSSSYGISIAMHVGVGLILAAIVIAVPQARKKAVVIAKREPKLETYNEKLKRDTKTTPKIEAEETVEKPIIIIEREDPLTKDVPKGTALSNITNKELDSTSRNDAFGPGGGAAGAYGLRLGKGSLAKEGGGQGTEDAVKAALRWLRFHQSPDGRWDSDGWEANCSRGPTCSGPGTNTGDRRYDTGVTALALLAFLGHGNTHSFGTFKRTVRKGLTWLKRQQQADGSIGFSGEETIYNHAIATMALCEAYALSPDITLKKYAQKAIDFCIEAQNPNLGWKYGRKTGRNDTSVTGWMVLALKAGRTAKLDVPVDAFSGARRWFERATDRRGDVGYETPGGGSAYLPANDGKYDVVPCMTAVSVICRILMGDDRRLADGVRRGARILMDNQPTWSQDRRKINFYYWYYGTYAMFQVGGEKWTKWNQAMQGALLDSQRMGACEDGSWDGVGEWCLAGGRVYATAINALTLEIYYRYERARAN